MWIRFLFIFFLLAFSPFAFLYGKWYTNGNIISQIKFEDLKEKHRIFLLDEETASFVDQIDPESKSLLLSLYNSTNEVIQSLLDYKRLSNEITNESFTLKDYIKNNITREEVSPSFETLLENRETGRIILKNADLMESLVIKKKALSQRIIIITGKVKIYFDQNTIEADKVVINSDTKDIYASGNLTLSTSDMKARGKKIIINAETKKGFISHPKGSLDLLNYSGDILKVNSEKHITVLKGQATYDTNEKPFFHFNAKTFEYYGKNKIIMDNITLFIHNHPFFYFPFFFQDPFSTGIIVTYGQTQREGWYIKNHMGFNFPVINTLEIDFNYFQKLGAYLRLENENKYSFHEYKISLATARFFEGRYLSQPPGSLFFSPNIEDDLSKEVRYRYKVIYDHSFNVATKAAKEKGINSIFDVHFKRTGDDRGSSSRDPFFTFDLETRILKEIQLFSFLDQGNDVESTWLRNRGVVDQDEINFNFTQTLPGASLHLRGQWNFRYLEDLNVTNDQDPDRYIQYKESIEFPDFRFNKNGVIDPKNDEKINRKFFANLAYNVYLNYKLVTHFTNTSPFTFERFQRHDNTLSSGFRLNRSFYIDQKLNKEKFKVMNAIYSPNFEFGYNRKWGGEDLGEDFKSQNDDNTFLFISTRHQMNFFFPSQHFQQLMSKAYGYKPMIPNLSHSYTYSLRKKEPLEDEVEDRSLFREWVDHSLSVDTRLNQKGFGLFYIPHLDFDHSTSIFFNYNLKPEKNADDTYEDYEFKKENILRLDGRYSLDLFYKPYKLDYRPFNFNYLLNYQFFDRNNSLVKTEVLDQNFTFDARYQAKNRNALFYLESIGATFTWNYFFREEDFLRDTMTFRFGFALGFLHSFRLNFQVQSINNNAHLYIKRKSQHFGRSHVNFFTDLWHSTGLAGSSKADRQSNRQNANFKLNSLVVQLDHDLGSWFMSLSYQLVPRTISTATSLRGFFFEQKIEMKINLKPEYEIEALSTGLTPWEVDLTPEELQEIQY